MFFNTHVFNLIKYLFSCFILKLKIYGPEKFPAVLKIPYIGNTLLVHQNKVIFNKVNAQSNKSENYILFEVSIKDAIKRSDTRF